MICTPPAVTILSGIVLASITLTLGVCPEAVLAAPSGYALVPAQLSMGSGAPPSAPPAWKRLSAPAKRESGLTQDEYKQLAEAINRMTPKERKRLAKAMKHLTPEGRRQLDELVKRQLAGNGTGSQLARHSR